MGESGADDHAKNEYAGIGIAFTGQDQLSARAAASQGERQLGENQLRIRDSVGTLALVDGRLSYC